MMLRMTAAALVAVLIAFPCDVVGVDEKKNEKGCCPPNFIISNAYFKDFMREKRKHTHNRKIDNKTPGKTALTKEQQFEKLTANEILDILLKGKA